MRSVTLCKYFFSPCLSFLKERTSERTNERTNERTDRPFKPGRAYSQTNGHVYADICELLLSMSALHILSRLPSFSLSLELQPAAAALFHLGVSVLFCSTFSPPARLLARFKHRFGRKKKPNRWSKRRRGPARSRPPQVK